MLKTNNSDNYDEKQIKTKFNSHDKLPLRKTLKTHEMVIDLFLAIVISITHRFSWMNVCTN